MRPFQDQEYEAIPAEEKQGLEELHHSIKQARRKRVLAIFMFALIALSSLAAFGLVSQWWKSPSVGELPTVEESAPSEKLFMEHAARAVGDRYLLGTGRGDITGTSCRSELHGLRRICTNRYVFSCDTRGRHVGFSGTGLRQRLYSRAFIVGDVNNATDRFVYLVLDIASGDTAIRYGILQGLAALGPAYSVYTKNNVAVTGTHSHSGPGAFFNYLLPQITSLGFSKESYQAIVDGTVLSIKRAHESLKPGFLAFADTTISDANINRSPSAYLANPTVERAKYSDDTDKTLTVLRFQRESDGLNTGILAWHSVHGTSMYANNTHVTGDNKGLSSYLFEKAMQTDTTAAPGFVAAFSQSSVGDTTPNVLGAWCDDGSGTQCSFDKSTCSGNAATCHGRGPAFQKLDLGVSSCYEIGRRVYQGAKTLYDTFDSNSTPVKDPSVKSYHIFNDMRYYKFPLSNGTIVQTCPAALGYGFAAGTSDWPGPLDFTQGSNDSSSQNPFWAVVSGIVSTPTPEQKACHSPKPILLNVGEISTPYPWSPNIIDVQSLRVGQFIIITSPSESSTMAGRRWKAAVSAAAISKSVVPAGTAPKVVLGGIANTYAHYAVTQEEYGVQRYEGASTLYGQWHAEAFTYLSTSNIGFLKAGSTPLPASGPAAPNNVPKTFNFISPVVYDQPPVGNSFGQVITQPLSTYKLGSVVLATFWGANPRNNFRLEGTFAAVEQLQTDGTWKQVRSDYDWALVYTWIRVDGFWGTSRVEISWETESWAVKGTYRIKYYGDSKPLIGKISAFTGTSNTFTLT